MININFTKILGEKVKQLYLIIWPPFGEEKMSDIDISIGFVFESNEKKMFVISTCKEDNWSPSISEKQIPTRVYSFDIFAERMKKWMNNEIESIIGLEYYNVSMSNAFINFTGEKVRAIEIIKIQESEPFGVKIIFDKDFIISTPISDGNTIETKKFNKFNNIKHFETMGKIKFINILNKN
jgi:hypothetical protein